MVFGASRLGSLSLALRSFATVTREPAVAEAAASQPVGWGRFSRGARSSRKARAPRRRYELARTRFADHPCLQRCSGPSRRRLRADKAFIHKAKKPGGKYGVIQCSCSRRFLAISQGQFDRAVPTEDVYFYSNGCPTLGPTTDRPAERPKYLRKRSAKRARAGRLNWVAERHSTSQHEPVIAVNLTSSPQIEPTRRSSTTPKFGRR